VTSRHQLSRDEILALPPASTLADLAGALGVSEPVARVMQRTGQLEALGIRANKMGSQWRVVTSTVWAYLGLEPPERASSVPAGPAGPGPRGPTGPTLRAVAGGEGGNRGP
jgi:hypothetical protein